MGLPYSRNQIDKLGDRLAAAESPSDQDLEMLEDVIICHAAVVSAARQRLDALETGSGVGNVSITGRAKTTQTIIEKVRRNRTRLSSMEDLAGVRLVADMTLSQQDRIVGTVEDMFADGGLPRTIDRRIDPRAGYRAVHVIARLDGVGVEIQVRTTPQDLWANVFEKVADYLGREIRYGEPLKPIPGTDPAGIQALVQALIDVSDANYRMELTINAAPHVDVSFAASALRSLLDAVTGLGS